MGKQSPSPKKPSIDFLHPHPVHVGLLVLALLFATFVSVDQAQKIQNQGSRASNPSFVSVNPSRIDLNNWKLQLPVGKGEHVTEVSQPLLISFEQEPLYRVTNDGESLHFRAPVNGYTTADSDSPSTVLREMVDDGLAEASWQSSFGTHTLSLDEAITAVPMKQKHVVAGGLYDGKNELVTIRLEYPTLYLNVEGKNVFTLDPEYKLNKRFAVKFEVDDGNTNIYYNGSSTPVYVFSKSFSNAYFIVGATVKSNCTTEDVCADNNFGAVSVYQALINHK